MSQIIVSADYFGTAMRIARRENKIPKWEFRRLFDCNEKQYHRYEYGIDLIPHDVLVRIFKYAAMMDTVLRGETQDRE